MAHDRKFRFAAQLSKAPDGSARSWAEQARKAEDLGYSALLMPDHFGDQLAPVPALAAVAAATTTLRMGSLVFGNDYRHPFVLAKEAATLDVLSEGRFEMSLGAGWMRTDYDEAGLTYDHPAVRVARFEEAVKVVQGLLRTDGPFNFHGEHYEVLGHTLTPRPVQQPGPPLIIGGGGKRVLSFAARQADIVSINVNLREGTGGAETAADATPERTRTKIGWVKEAAGDRFADLELNSLIGFVMVTDDAAGTGRPDGPGLRHRRRPTRCTCPWRSSARSTKWPRSSNGAGPSTGSPTGRSSRTPGRPSVPSSPGWPAHDRRQRQCVGGDGDAPQALRRARLHRRRPPHRHRTPRAPADPARLPVLLVSTTLPCSTASRAGRRVLLLDMLGYGLSAKPDRAYTMALQADVAAAFVAALGIDRLALLTHDMGDTVGGELLARRAEGAWSVEVTRRVLTNGSIYIDQAHLTNGQQFLLGLPDEVLAPDSPLDAASIARSLRDTFSPLTPSIPPGWPTDPLPEAAAQVVHDDGQLLLPRLIRYIEERRASEHRFTGAIESDPCAPARRLGHGRPHRRPVHGRHPVGRPARRDGRPPRRRRPLPHDRGPARFLDAALPGLD